MADAQSNPAVPARRAAVVGTAEAGSKGLVALGAIVWACWIAFLLYLLLARA